MRACWIDYGNDADYARLHALGIDEPIYDLRDPRVTKAYLTNVANAGFKPGVYACWNWSEVAGKGGPQFAEWVSEMIKPLHRSSSFPSVHLNDETHDAARIVAMLERWRVLRPTKRTVWTLEAMQGGLFGHVLQPGEVLDPESPVARINATKVVIGPQAYTGNMTRMESATVVLDLVRRGFDSLRIASFLDASALGYWWDGVAYTQGRLP